MATAYVIFKVTDDSVETEGISLTFEAANKELHRRAQACYDNFRGHSQIKWRGPLSVSVKGVADFYAEEVPLLS